MSQVPLKLGAAGAHAGQAEPKGQARPGVAAISTAWDPRLECWTVTVNYNGFASAAAARTFGEGVFDLLKSIPRDRAPQGIDR